MITSTGGGADNPDGTAFQIAKAAADNNHAAMRAAQENQMQAARSAIQDQGMVYLTRKASDPRIKMVTKMGYKKSNRVGSTENLLQLNRTTVNTNYVSPLLTKRSFAPSALSPSVAAQSGGPGGKVNPWAVSHGGRDSPNPSGGADSALSNLQPDVQRMILGNKQIEEAEWQMKVDLLQREQKQLQRAKNQKEEDMMQIIGVLGADFPTRSQSTLGQTLTKDFLGASRKESIAVEQPKVEIRLDPQANATMTSSYARSTFGNVVNGPKKMGKHHDRSASSPPRRLKKKGGSKESRNHLMVPRKRTKTMEPRGHPVAVKQMTMDRVDFGEMVFGGNIKKNLKQEANLNQSIMRTKKLATSRQQGSSFSFFGPNATMPEDLRDNLPIPLRKHLPQKRDDQMLTTVFAKLPPKNPIRQVLDTPESPKATHLEGPSHIKGADLAPGNMPIVFFADIIESAVQSSQDSSNLLSQFRLRLDGSQEFQYLNLDKLTPILYKGSN